MGLFNKKGELEKLMEQRDQLQKEATEVQGKVNKTRNAMELAETENMIEGTQTAQKKVNKFKKALEGYQKELEGLNEKAQEVGSNISKLNDEKYQAEKEEASKEYYEDVKTKEVHSQLYKELEKLYKQADFKAHNSPADPKALREMAGVEFGRPLQPDHGEFFTKSREVEAKAKEDAEKEAQKVLAELKQFMDMQ